MSANVSDIANYLIKLANEQTDEDFRLSEGITQLKLQKLLYFVQASFLACLNENAFDEDIIAYKYGPVVRSILDKYKDQGSSLLTIDEGWDENILTEKYKNTIKRVWEIYGCYSSSRLVDMTHSHSPWQNTDHNGIIEKEKIKEFYTGKIYI